MDTSKGSWLTRFAVTWAQWLTVLGSSPWEGQPFTVDDPGSPAEYVSWQDAQELVARLNPLGEGRFRLPTEAEWEYAARADSPSYRMLGVGFRVCREE